MTDLKEGEKLEDLQYKGLKIIQNASGFRFGTDSVLLAGFAKANRREKVLDMGAGTGVIAILLAGRTGAALTALEIQKEQCAMARRSVELNGQDIEVVEADMRTAHGVLGLGTFDAAVCNPPYYPASGGAVSSKGEEGFRGAATHDVYCTLREVAESAARLIKFGGRFYTCCPAARLAEAFFELKTAGLEPKRLRLVASNAEKAPYLALIEAKKGAAPGLKMEKQLNVTDPDGSYTEETNRIYHRENDR
ncbi:MAG: methyltransferase [Clostridia bacterium]|nr:methyltransferase [Clostridia bacterium]